MARVKWGGIKLGERVYSLSYADDMVHVKEDEGSMRNIMKRLERYLDGKGLALNTEKIKIVRFRKGRGRMSKVNWGGRGRR